MGKDALNEVEGSFEFSMSRRKFLKIVGAAAMSAGFAGCAQKPPAETAPQTTIPPKPARTLTLLQQNDTHAYFELHNELFWEQGKAVYRKVGGYARIATLVKQVKAEHPNQVLYFDCGDAIHGTYSAVSTKGASTVRVLNKLGIDALTPHWEFAYGPKEFKKRATEMNFPVLACNIYDKSTNALVPEFKPYMVKTVNELKVGVFGLGSNIIDKVMPPAFGEGHRFELGVNEAKEIISKLRKEEKVDLVVAISHLGMPQETQLLKDVKGIDVMLGGHTHNRLYKPLIVGDSIYIQSGSHGSFLGRLDLVVENGKVKEYKHQLITVEESVKPDAEMEALINEILAPSRAMLSEVVGKTSTDLNRNTVLEATMDNFLLQSIADLTGMQLAFSNGWRYGAPIKAGGITMNDLWNIIPPNPQVSTVDLTGKELWDMLEDNLEKTFAANPYNQMGGYVKRCLGLRCYFKIENPAGSRIQSLFVGEEPVDFNKLYKAAYVTWQGVPSNYGKNRKNLDTKAVDALKAYVQKASPVSAELKGTFVAV